MEITLIEEDNTRYFIPLFPSTDMSGHDISLGVVDEGLPVGVLLADMEDREIVIRWLYVDVDSWSLGAGTMLMDHLCLFARQAGAGCITATYGEDDMLFELDRFLETYGFTLLPCRGRYYKTKLYYYREFFERIKPMVKKNSGACSIIKASDSREYHWMRLHKLIDGKDDDSVSADFIKEKSRYDLDLSLLKLNGDEPTGCILFERMGEDLLISYCCNLNRQNPIETGILLYHAIENVAKEFHKNTVIYMNAINDASSQLVIKSTNKRAKLVNIIKTRCIVI